MIRGVAVALVVCCSFSAWAKDHQLLFDQDADVYRLTWDDRRISEAEMREIAVLSPYVSFSAEFSIGVTATRSPSGQIVNDKVLLAPALELCSKGPGSPCNRDPEKPDALFLENAEHNLQDSQAQIQKLRAEKIPPALEPVRGYLLESLQRSAELEEARFQYLKSGAVKPLRSLLCRECECTAREESLLERLQAETDPGRRLELSRADWHNRVLECERQRHPKTYPVEDWERFVREFRIRETRTAKHIE